MTKEELEQKVKEGVDLTRANLTGANLTGANLTDADLWRADLRDADLRGANLMDANLRDANLRDADLRDADLRGANLRDADLRDANLRDADLRDADLRDADLRGANLRDADLRDADLMDADLPHYQICPEEGSFIAYKKLSTDVIAKLQIPEDAQRTSSLVSRKCRASHVFVVEGEGKSPNREDDALQYSPNSIVRADSFDPDPRIECTNGIHFFMTYREAEDWVV